MPPKRHTQAGHISKGKANTTIHRVTTPALRQPDLIGPPVLPVNDPNPLQIPSLTPRIPSSVKEIPHINIILLNTLITHLEDYETGLNAVKTIIHDNQIKAHQANLDIFNQLMEHLDNLEIAFMKRIYIDSQISGILSDISSLIAVNVLT